MQCHLANGYSIFWTDPFLLKQQGHHQMWMQYYLFYCRATFQLDIQGKWFPHHSNQQALVPVQVTFRAQARRVPTRMVHLSDKQEKHIQEKEKISKVCSVPTLHVLHDWMIIISNWEYQTKETMGGSGGPSFLGF